MNAKLPMDLRESGRLILVREEHPKNAPVSIDERESGRLMLVREEHPLSTDRVGRREHSDIGVTMNVYTHLGLEDAAAEMARMGQGLIA